MLYAVVLVGLAARVPFFRYVGSLGDEGVLLHGAARILDGEALYRDFFGILPPGGYLIMAGWLKLFGFSFAGVRTLAVAVIVAIAALVYSSTRLASGSRSLAGLIAMAWAVLSPGTWTVINHHWFTTAASMASAVGLLIAVGGAPTRKSTFAAGLFAGIAAMVTSARGALVCVAVLAVLLILRAGVSRLATAVAGMVLFPSAMILYLVASGTLAAAFDEVVRYPAIYYGGIQAVPFGTGAAPQHLAVVAVFPIAFVLAGAVLIFERLATWRDPRFQVSLALAIAGLLGSYPRPDRVHLAFTVALASPLFALAASRVPRLGRVVVGAVSIGLCFLGLVGAIATAVIVSRLPMVTTARGIVVPGPKLLTDFGDLVSQIQKIPPDRAIFFYPYDPLLAYLTGHRHPAAFDVMVPGYTTREQFYTACVSIGTGVEWAVIDRQLSDPSFLRESFPAMRDPDPPEKRDFEMALRLGFDDVVHTSIGFEIRRRTGTSPSVPCERI